MKVKDLTPGMMVRPIINKYTSRRMFLNISDCEAQSVEDQNKTKVVKSVACGAWRGVNDVAIYIKTERSKWWVHGVRTHHLLLVNGSTAIISGYEVRYLEPVK